MSRRTKKTVTIACLTWRGKTGRLVAFLLLVLQTRRPLESLGLVLI